VSRRLPWAPAPVPDETLPSYVDRLAFELGVTLKVALALLGLWSGSRRDLGVYGLHIAPERRRMVLEVSGLSEATLESMLLTRFDGLVGDIQSRLQTPRLITSGMWLYVAGSNVCPECLAERKGAWDIHWKLPWVFACTRHNRLLHDICPGCQNEFRAFLKGRTTVPRALEQVPAPTLCPNSAVDTVIGRDARRCNEDIIAMPPVLVDERIVIAQKTIREAIAGHPSTVCGERTAPAGYMSELRALVSLMRQLAEPEDFADLRPEALAAVERAVAARAPGKQIIRHTHSAPRDPWLRAGLMTLAVEMLSASDDEAYSLRLAPLAARARTRLTARVPPREFSLRFGATPLLTRAMLANQPPWCPDAARRLQRPSPSLTSASRTPALEPRWVPQLVWPWAWDTHLRPFFGRQHHELARYFCSLAVVRVAAGLSWPEAADALNVPFKAYDRHIGRFVWRMCRERTTSAFAEALKATVSEAIRRVATGCEPDYEHRRQRFSALTDIPAPVWRDMLEKTGQRRPTGPTTGRLAAVWLWTSITGGMTAQAPGLAAVGRAETMQMYRTWRSSRLHLVQDLLESYGRELLNSDVA
jgi:hypothetical protein